MSLTEKMENHKYIQVEGGPDLAVCRQLLVVIRQERMVLEYVPQVISSTELCVVIPYEDAMKLCDNTGVCIQLMGTDAEGLPFASYVYEEDVMELIKEEGYRASDD